MQLKSLKLKFLCNMTEITLDSLIKEFRERIPKIQYIPDYIPYYEYRDMEQYEKWLAAAKRFLNINFPEDKYVSEFEEISKKRLGPKQQQRMLAILEAFSNLPTVVPQSNKEQNNKGVNITANFNNTNSQSQSQEQTTAINIFQEAIKDDLTGRQLKEIIEIIKESGDDKKKMRNGIIEKLKSFGSDVASNIVANILTNPAIWSCF